MDIEEMARKWNKMEAEQQENWAREDKAKARELSIWSRMDMLRGVIDSLDKEAELLCTRLEPVRNLRTSNEGEVGDMVDLGNCQMAIGLEEMHDRLMVIYKRLQNAREELEI